MIRSAVVITSIALGVVAACASQKSGSSQEADVAEITRIHQKWLASITAGDLEQVLAPLAPDFVLLPPNDTALTGLAAARTFFQGRLAWSQGVTHTEAKADLNEVVATGDWGFVRVTSHSRVQPKSGGAPEGHNTKYIQIWRRQPDGSWKIARDIFSSNDPVGGRP